MTIHGVKDKSKVGKSKRKQRRKTRDLDKEKYEIEKGSEKPMNLFQPVWLYGNL